MAERKNSEKRIATNNRWTNAHYDRINIAVPKGRKDEIKALADTRGQSVNAYIISAVDEKMERDSGGAAAPGAAPVERALAESSAGRPQEAAEASAGAGMVSLPSDTLGAAQRAADAAGEAVPDFIRRAVGTQAQRDKSSLKLGINPVTGGKLEKEA